MWYTNPWFITLCSIALIIILFFIWAFIKAAQLAKLMDLFVKELIRAIPENKMNFNFEKSFTAEESNAVALVCKLDSASPASRSNKLESDITEMIEDYVKDLKELEDYNIYYNVEILKSKMVFSAYCELKEEVVGD